MPVFLGHTVATHTIERVPGCVDDMRVTYRPPDRLEDVFKLS